MAMHDFRRMWRKQNRHHRQGHWLLPLDCLAAGKTKLEKRTEKGNVMSMFLWLVVIGIAALVLLGMWSKIYSWIKSTYTTATGNTITGDDWLLALIAKGKSWKVIGLLKAARIEFAAIDDTDSVALLDGLIAKAATWDDEKPEPIVAVVTDSTAAAIEKLTAQLAAQAAEIAALKQTGA